MFENSLSPSDVMALSGNNDGWGNGSWLWFLVIIFLCGGWNRGGLFGGNGNGATDGYILTSDFANIERKIDSVNNGLCDGFYSQAQMINSLNNNISNVGYNLQNAIQGNTISGMQNTNAIQSQLAQCCCENEKLTMQSQFNLANESCATRQAIADSTRQILDALNTQEVNALKDRIAEQNQQINSLQLSASQSAQNNYLLSRLQPTPVPAYPYSMCYPYACTGTTIA